MQSWGHASRYTKIKDAGLLSLFIRTARKLNWNCRRFLLSRRKNSRFPNKGRPLKHTYEPDFICYDKVILEIKAVSKLTDEHRAQVQNYLRATGFKLGLLVNFGHYPKIEYERIVI